MIRISAGVVYIRSRGEPLKGLNRDKDFTIDDPRSPWMMSVDVEFFTSRRRIAR